MSFGYLRKFSQRLFKLQLSRDNLRAKGPGESISWAFREPKIQNLPFGGHHGVAFEIYRLCFVINLPL